MSYTYRIQGWEILYPENRNYFVISLHFSIRVVDYGISGSLLWEMSWSGIGVSECVFHTYNFTWLWHICWRIEANIFISDTFIHYQHLTLSFSFILHLTPFWELVFSWDPLGTFVYIDRALPARLYFVFLSWYVWCMIGMDLAWYISGITVFCK